MEFGSDDCIGRGEEFTADGHRRFIGSVREISVCNPSPPNGTREWATYHLFKILFHELSLLIISYNLLQ